jgi:hypothetical protein
MGHKNGLLLNEIMPHDTTVELINKYVSKSYQWVRGSKRAKKYHEIKIMAPWRQN